MATVLFVTPHADDETLSMGAGIRLHVETGHDVHVLLLTCGLGSGAQAVTGLNDEDFIAARDDEMFRATRLLGVRTENVHIDWGRAADASALAVAEAEEAIGEFLEGYPGTWLKSYTNKPAAGRHADHQAAGQAAVNLYQQGACTNLRLYVEPWVVPAFQKAYPSTPLGTEQASPAGRARVVQALDSYGDVDHVGFKYGIGHISVPTYFTQVRANPVSRYHVP